MRNKLRAFLNRGRPGERGITGLETAIILIAFVVVASVFAYTVLAAGMFSSQKASDAVFNGLEGAQSGLQVEGSIITQGRSELNDCDEPLQWETNDSTHLSISRETTAKKEGLASMHVTYLDAAAADGDYVYCMFPEARNMAATDVIDMWIGVDTTSVAATLDVGFDDENTRDDGDEPEYSIPAITYASGTCQWYHVDTTSTGLANALAGLRANPGEPG